MCVRTRSGEEEGEGEESLPISSGLYYYFFHPSQHRTTNHLQLGIWRDEIFSFTGMGCLLRCWFFYVRIFSLLPKLIFKHSRAMEWLNCAPFHNNNWNYCVCCYAGNSHHHGGEAIVLHSKNLFFIIFISSSLLFTVSSNTRFSYTSRVFFYVSFCEFLYMFSSSSSLISSWFFLPLRA